MERMLKEQKKISESLQLVKELKTKLDNQECSPKRTTKSKIEGSPQICKNSVRTCYKELMKKEDYDGFDLSFMFNDPENKSSRERLIKAVVDENWGKDSCPFSKVTIQAAVKQYFNSQKDKKHKMETGKQEAHKVKCRRQGRVRENCRRMKIGLTRKTWSEQKKKRMDILNPSYMSEEETDTEELEDGRTLKMGYKIKTLPWIHTKVMEINNFLMASYLDTLSPVQRASYRQRQVCAEEVSSKPNPVIAPSGYLLVTFNFV